MDARTGLAIAQNRVGGLAPIPRGVGVLIYRCYTCGNLIPIQSEVLFVDDTPGREWASNIAPAKTSRRTTTHHDWHMASQQYED
jgi:hypothetical protein